MLEESVRSICDDYDGLSATSATENMYIQPIRDARNFLGREKAHLAGAFAEVKFRENLPID